MCWAIYCARGTKYPWCALPSISLLFLLLSHSHSFFATGKPSQLVAVCSFLYSSLLVFVLYIPSEAFLAGPKWP